MKVVLYFFMVLAALGLGLSVAAHCLALAGMPIPGSLFIWILHVGIFVVWLPTVLTSAQLTLHAARKDFWKVALAGCPTWMRRAGYVLVGYAIINFLVFMATTMNQPRQQRQPSDSPSVVRGISGHWMIFYGAAFAVLYSRLHAPGLNRDRKCPQGHSVSPTARFCPECGHALPDGTASV